MLMSRCDKLSCLIMKCVVITLFIFLVGCTNSPPLGNQQYSNEPIGMYIVPASGVNHKVISYLYGALAKQHEIRVKVTTEMGLDDKHFDSEHQQFISEELDISAIEIAKSLRTPTNSPPIIVIIQGDMNSNSFRFRYIFSQHFANKISVISLARINPINYGLERNDELTAQRALKLVNKALGYHLYGYKPSSDINNVMYGPIMGVEDLDKINSWYR